MVLKIRVREDVDVGVISKGKELVESGKDKQPGKKGFEEIYNSKKADLDGASLACAMYISA